LSAAVVPGSPAVSAVANWTTFPLALTNWLSER
jgi:hypothetical protein